MTCDVERTAKHPTLDAETEHRRAEWWKDHAKTLEHAMQTAIDSGDVTVLRNALDDEYEVASPPEPLSEAEKDGLAKVGRYLRDDEGWIISKEAVRSVYALAKRLAERRAASPEPATPRSDYHDARARLRSWIGIVLGLTSREREAGPAWARDQLGFVRDIETVLNATRDQQ